MISDRIVAEVLAASLKRHGVEVLFSQSLPSAAVLAAEDAGLRQFTYRTENAGGAMADGYARISHKVGIVTAQNGPAATLLVAPLAEALKSSVPVIALVQEVERPQADPNAFQELDHIALFGGCAKWIRRVTEVSRVEDYLDMAFAAATGGRPGPAVLLLPADLLKEPASASGGRRESLGSYPLDRLAPDPSRLDAPLPVLTTVMGKGACAENHPLSLGVGGNVPGRFSPSRYMKAIIEHA